MQKSTSITAEVVLCSSRANPQTNNVTSHLLQQWTDIGYATLRLRILRRDRLQSRCRATLVCAALLRLSDLDCFDRINRGNTTPLILYCDLFARTPPSFVDPVNFVGISPLLPRLLNPANILITAQSYPEAVQNLTSSHLRRSLSHRGCHRRSPPRQKPILRNQTQPGIPKFPFNPLNQHLHLRLTPPQHPRKQRRRITRHTHLHMQPLHPTQLLQMWILRPGPQGNPNRHLLHIFETGVLSSTACGIGLC